jgi:hypothetical protein
VSLQDLSIKLAAQVADAAGVAAGVPIPGAVGLWPKSSSDRSWGTCWMFKLSRRSGYGASKPVSSGLLTDR